MSRLREDELIARFLAPLAKDDAAFGLRDDAAWLRGGFANGLVVTTDASVAGIHFFEDDDPADAAFKAIAVNISDLAAKGAEPLAYLLTLALAEGPSAEWMGRLVAGLADAHSAFGIALIGGDTVTAGGAWWMSVTALGRPGPEGMVRRGGARAGDAIYVSGTLGDAALGLRLRREGSLPGDLPEDEASYLVRRQRRPEPRLGLIGPLRRWASAAMDLSDGLAIDLGRMCAASHVSGWVEASRLPLSEAARKVIVADPKAVAAPLAGGDDYEILAAVPPGNCSSFEKDAAEAGVPVTRIGVFTEGDAAPLFLDATGEPIALKSTGWQHF